MQILLASNNAKKRRELVALLAPLGVDVVTPEDIGGIPPVEEDAPTFTGNAAKKAESAARACAMWALADDSGLEVDALGGAPGVRSARYAGKHGDDAANNARLLAELGGLPPEHRGARFVCTLALASPDGQVTAVFEGDVRGRILDAPQGSNGFGYDPLFLFTEEGFAVTGRVFAELSAEEKSSVSHRGRALRALAAGLQDLLTRSPGAPDRKA